MTNYRDSKGRTISLKKRIGGSGEGDVHRTDRTGYLAKIYKKPTSQRTKKLGFMVANPPKNPTAKQNHVSIAWPTELIYDGGTCVGFLMPSIENAKELNEVYSTQRRNQLLPTFNWYYLHVTAQNIALIVNSLHTNNYIIGDMKPQNLMVNTNGMVSIIDTDSFQVTDSKTKRIHFCPVTSPEYTPPELIGKNISQKQQFEFHDQFRLAIIIYQLLFGWHPFAEGKWTGFGKDPDYPNERISKGLWLYAQNSSYQPSPVSIPLNVVHPQLEKLFLKCFNDGHRTPTLRPSAKDWHDALRLATGELIRCNRVANHIYSRTYGKCYWCERKDKIGTDIWNPQPQKSKPSSSQPRQSKPNPNQNKKKITTSKPPTRTYTPSVITPVFPSSSTKSPTRKSNIGWGFWWLWLVASVLGLMTFGTLLPITQWLVLRSRLSRLHVTGGWAFGTAVGMLAGPFMGGITATSIFQNPNTETATAGTIVTFAVWFTFLGGMQWLVLRRWVSKAEKWILTNTIGGIVIGAIALAMVGNEDNSELALTFYAVCFSIFYAITGFVLMRLLQHPVSKP